MTTKTKRLLKRSRGIISTTIEVKSVVNSFQHMKRMPLSANARDVDDNSSTLLAVSTRWGDGNNIEGIEGRQGVG